MAISTLDGVVAGMRPPETIMKIGTAPEVAGTPHSTFYSAGRPGAAVAPSPGVAGAALTTYAGQIPFTNPASGNAYGARFAGNPSVASVWWLCDRLWHNSGLSVTSTSSQAVNSVAWPARDRDGSTNGENVLIGIEVSTVTGAGTPTCTLGYTDQSGNAGATQTLVGLTAANVGTFMVFPLAAGDTGVRSIQTYQQSATWTSGVIHLVAFRILAVLCPPGANQGQDLDVVAMGMPRMYDNTVPFLVQVPTATTATNFFGQLIYTHG